MAPSEESGNLIQHLCLVSTEGIICMIGLMIHFFIVGVSVIDWLKRRPLTTVDLLIVSIGTSRIIFQFASLFYLFCGTFCRKHSTAYDISIYIIGNSSTFCNIWLSVLLSVFYSLKISDFHTVSFLYLKKIISQRVLGLMIVFVLLSIGFSSIGALPLFVNTLKNSTRRDLHIDQIKEYIRIVFILWNVLPLLFYVIASVALLGSLCHQMLRMKRDNNVTSHLDAYFRTVKFTIASLFCFAVYVSIFMFGIYYGNLGFAGFYLVWNCFPVLHSIYLIYMTARLRSHFFKIFHGMTKGLLLSRGSESRSGVQMQIISQ